MFIHDLAHQTGIAATTIRFYETKGLLPRPRRAANNYRQYTLADAERLRFVASARHLGLSLDDIAEILAARDQGIAPCQRVLDAIGQRLAEIDRRVADLLALRDSLQQLHVEGATLPLDDINGDHCVCYLLKTYRDTGQITVKRGECFDECYGRLLVSTGGWQCGVRATRLGISTSYKTSQHLPRMQPGGQSRARANGESPSGCKFAQCTRCIVLLLRHTYLPGRVF